MRDLPDQNLNPWCHPYIVYDKEFTGTPDDRPGAEGKSRSDKKSDAGKSDVGKKKFDFGKKAESGFRKSDEKLDDSADAKKKKRETLCFNCNKVGHHSATSCREKCAICGAKDCNIWVCKADPGKRASLMEQRRATSHDAGSASKKPKK